MKISSKNEQNLEYHLHENNSDNGEEQEKKSYISVKLEPKMADSNLSSPSPVKEKIKKGQKDFFKHEDFSNNLITKPEKKIFE